MSKLNKENIIRKFLELQEDVIAYSNYVMDTREELLRYEEKLKVIEDRMKEIEEEIRRGVYGAFYGNYLRGEVIAEAEEWIDFYLNNSPGWNRDYEELRIEYQELKREYEEEKIPYEETQKEYNSYREMLSIKQEALENYKKVIEAIDMTNQ